MPLDFRARPILYVDPDPASVELFRGATARHFAVKVAASGRDALGVLERPEVLVIVAEHTLPDMTAVELFERARVLRPEATRLLTAETLSPELAEAAINRGRVAGYKAKPWQADTLRAWLEDALESRLRECSSRGLEMSLWHGGQVATATTIYEELVHELSNPLGALEINASLVADLLQGMLADEAAGAQDVRATAQAAAEAHSDSLAAIEQMKSLAARMRQGRRTRGLSQGPCDAMRVIDATVSVVRAEVEKVARLEVCVEAAPTIQIEAAVLGQVLMNLLVNAAQAVPAQRRHSNRITIVAETRAERFLISVRDNGPGVAPGLRDRVFEPFFSTREGGTGLGLAICRELVTRARGTITVQDEPDGGARFDIEVPIAG